MFLIKLGGSVITNKAKKCCFKHETMDRLAAEIKKANKQVIIIHGAGSFGHILAKQYKLNDGFKQKKQLKGFSLTHTMVQRLNTLVLTSLQHHGLPAVSLPPHALLSLSNHALARIDYNMFKKYLALGFMPVSFGDVVLDNQLGFSICSGDLLMQLLAAEFQPEKVIFVMDEDGLYSANPKTTKHATFFENTTIPELETLTTSLDTHADVTEGMKGKIHTIKQIAKTGTDTVLLNGNIHNRLYDTLKGKKVRSTIVYGDEP
ncbi:MAG: isopentenyl phosphate kinase family protein [Candidatus Thermoplasmatota archaeon]|nr:isopentenyl phosphate kinase family protein [Candidatus Thermoplasmatota archaeon]